MRVATATRRVVPGVAVVELPLFVRRVSATQDGVIASASWVRITTDGFQTIITCRSFRSETTDWEVSRRKLDVKRDLGNLLHPPYQPATKAEFDEQVAEMVAFFEAAALGKDPTI